MTILQSNSGPTQGPSPSGKQTAGLTAMGVATFGKILTLLAQFRRDAPRGVLWPISGFITAKASRTIAFLLPIKVILLAGSPGVPSYFRSFIAPDAKPVWIVGLAISSVILYGVALGAQRWAEHRGSLLANHYATKSRSLLTAGNENAVSARQTKRVLQWASETTFLVLAGIVVGIINLQLLLFTIAMIGMMFLAWTIAERTERWRDAIHNRQRRNFLLSVCSQMVFLATFFVLIVQLLFIGSLTVFGALISLIFMRQITGAAVNMIKLSIEIITGYGYLDALIDPGKPVQRRQPTPLLPRLPGFEADGRRQAVGARLNAHGLEPERLQLCWLDHRPGGILQYDVDGLIATGSLRARWRLFAPHAKHHWVNETVLFSHIERPDVCAATPIDRFEWQGHDCDLLRLLPADQAASMDRRSAATDIYNKLASVIPPRPLQIISAATRPPLEARFDETAFSRMEVALDSDDERAIYERLIARVGDIRATLAALPQMIYTRCLGSASVDYGLDGQPVLLHWVDWMIVPVGTGFEVDDADVLAKLEEVVHQRKDGRDVSVRDLKLAALADRLERLYHSNSYAAMLPLMDEMAGHFPSWRRNGGTS